VLVPCGSRPITEARVYSLGTLDDRIDSGLATGSIQGTSRASAYASCRGHRPEEVNRVVQAATSFAPGGTT